MTPRVLLLTGAGVLAAAHVAGVLCARPLFRPAAGGGRRRPSRVILGTAIGAAVLIAGYAVLRVAVITFSTTRQSTSSTDQNVWVWGLPAVTAVLLPLLLALASLGLGAVAAARGSWGAAGACGSRARTRRGEGWT